ncbi:flagellar hook assembly protein FlgD [Vulgatibacter sp.]|uniref:flagellar hook assembly protein FlgD n=1 Tax=Vulgatibacter sp. TaxID=1971226 RepID=UPI0035667C26
MNASAIGASSTGGAAESKNSLGKDEFVKLLVTQLSNQDPTAPMDSKDFVAQLAQFANVELLQGVEGRLDALLVAQAANNQTAAAGLVGREVLYRTDEIQLGESGATVVANLDAPAASVTVTIQDEAGNTVRTLRLGAAAEGPLDVAWDGRDDGGTLLPPGSYGVKIVAADTDGASVPVEQHARGVAHGVSFENGFPELLIGTTRIKLSEIVELHTA